MNNRYLRLKALAEARDDAVQELTRALRAYDLELNAHVTVSIVYDITFDEEALLEGIDHSAITYIHDDHYDGFGWRREETTMKFDVPGKDVEFLAGVLSCTPGVITYSLS